MSSFMDDSMIGRWLSELPMDDPTRKSTSHPQLRRFVHHEKPIRYIQFLGGGTEGDVYLVKIEGKEYALKVFKQWRFDAPLSIKRRLKERETHYVSPIANEARAFARLDSLGQNGTWAVKCHGWMKLSGKQRPKCLSHHTPWAIVKDYIPNPVTLDDVPEIRRKMKIARKALLFPDDTQPRNYRGSFLVDLGRVTTYPYPRVLWSNEKRRKYFKSFDKEASEWVECVRDGEVISGSINEILKENILSGILWAENHEMYKEADNLRLLIEKVKKYISVPPLETFHRAMTNFEKDRERLQQRQKGKESEIIKPKETKIVETQAHDGLNTSDTC